MRVYACFAFILLQFNMYVRFSNKCISNVLTVKKSIKYIIIIIIIIIINSYLAIFTVAFEKREDMRFSNHTEHIH